MRIAIPVVCQNGHKAEAYIDIVGLDAHYRGVASIHRCDCPMAMAHQGWRPDGPPRVYEAPTKELEHDFHKNCGRGDCGGGCMLCTLSVCKRCGLLEGALTSDCPGKSVHQSQTDKIYAGLLDFRKGAWVAECSPHSPAAYRKAGA